MLCPLFFAIHCKTVNVRTHGRSDRYIDRYVTKAIILPTAKSCKEELAGDVLLWQPKHGKQSAGRPKKTYIDQLISDTGCSYQELPAAMGDRDEWGKRVMANRASST